MIWTVSFLYIKCIEVRIEQKTIVNHENWWEQEILYVEEIKNIVLWDLGV